MILSRRVALGGQQLDELHERIVIRSVDVGVPHENVRAESLMGHFGQRIVDQHWENLEVTVTYAIDVPKRNMALRRQIFETVNKWAMQKGWLTVNWMEDRRMYVDKVVYPSAGDMWNWTDEYTIAFRAYGLPFWMAVTPTQVNVNETSGGTRLSFSNLGLGGSETLNITHGTDGLLRCRIGGRSVYNKLEAGSSDRLMAAPGMLAVQMSASRAGNLSVRHYGGYV